MNTSSHSSTPSRAFTLVELLVVIAIIALLISIILPALGKARKVARTAVCTSNMSQYGKGLLTYASDAKGVIAQYNWNTSDSLSSFSDLNGSTVLSSAHGNQMADIVRRLYFTNFRPYSARLVNRNTSFLVMIDAGVYGSDKLVENGVVCPEDRSALIWRRNAAVLAPVVSDSPGPEVDAILNDAPLPGNIDKKQYSRMLPFWSSYQMIPNSWSPEILQPGATALIRQSPLSGAGNYDLYVNTDMKRAELRRFDQVFFPSQKVVLFDLFDRHFAKRGMFHAVRNAQQPLLMFDGSVNPRRTADSDEGWHPNFPHDETVVTQYTYTPSIPARDPPTSTGQSSEAVKGHYRWTRKGLAGVDFPSGKSAQP